MKMLRNKLSVKSVSAISAAALAVGLLGAISPAKAVVDCTGATQDTADCTVLTINTFGDVILPALVTEYRKLHPEIKLSIKKSDLDALNGTGLYTQCAAGGAGNPDIAAVEISYSGFWRAYPQCFVDLKTMRTTVGNKSATDLKKDYLAWRWEHGVGYNDSVIGIPTDVGGLEVAYRWDLFKAKGLPYKRDDVSKAWSTWPKFIEFGKKFNAKLSPADKKAKKGFMDNVGTIYAAVMNQGTEKYYRNNGTDQGQLIYKTNKQVRKAYDLTISASKAGIGTRIGQFSSDWNVGMTKGTFAVMLSPAWMMDYIKGQAPNTRGKWDIADIPGGGGNQGGSQLTIPKGAKHKQEAWDFITWYLAPAQQLKAFQTYGLFPSTPSLYTNPSLVGYKDPFFNNAPVGAIYVDGVKKLKPIFEGKLQRCIDMAMGSAISLVANGKEKDANKAFKTGIANADKCK
ncbi:MAG: extracellular solute-binding protein [Microbacteriaceae bacterium]|nr:extracellular solute-binding protein [Microbacteriaceae bacterium]